MSRENVQGTAEEDGGRRGWIAVLGLWCRNFVWVVVAKGLGLMLPTVQEQLYTQTWVVGWITAMVTVAIGLVCKFYPLNLIFATAKMKILATLFSAWPA